MRRFPLVHAFSSALINHTFGIAHDDIVMRYANGLDQFCTRNGRGACAIHHHAHLLNVFARQVQRIDKASCRDDCRAMLVIMHDRNLHPLFQGLLNDEAFWGGNIFQINAAKARLHQRDGVDKGFGVFGVQFNVDRINIGKAFEENCLAFHHRLRGERTQIAHAQNGSPV